jgi:hypothetical protein
MGGDVNKRGRGFLNRDSKLKQLHRTQEGSKQAEHERNMVAA